MIMARPGRAAEHNPAIPPRRRSLIFTQKHSESAAFNFPGSHQLIITTPKSIFIWSRNGILPVFQSGTGGIVAARKAGKHRELLAVADSQVVLLHDMKRGSKRSYKLKGSDVRARLLAIRYQADIARAMFVCFDMHKIQTAFSSLLPSKTLCKHTP